MSDFYAEIERKARELFLLASELPIFNTHEYRETTNVKIAEKAVKTKIEELKEENILEYVLECPLVIEVDKAGRKRTTNGTLLEIIAKERRYQITKEGELLNAHSDYHILSSLYTEVYNSGNNNEASITSYTTFFTQLLEKTEAGRKFMEKETITIFDIGIGTGKPSIPVVDSISTIRENQKIKYHGVDSEEYGKVLEGVRSSIPLLTKIPLENIKLHRAKIGGKSGKKLIKEEALENKADIVMAFEAFHFASKYDNNPKEILKQIDSVMGSESFAFFFHHAGVPSIKFKYSYSLREKNINDGDASYHFNRQLKNEGRLMSIFKTPYFIKMPALSEKEWDIITNEVPVGVFNVSYENYAPEGVDKEAFSNKLDNIDNFLTGRMGMMTIEERRVIFPKMRRVLEANGIEEGFYKVHEVYASHIMLPKGMSKDHPLAKAVEAAAAYTENKLMDWTTSIKMSSYHEPGSKERPGTEITSL